MKFFWGKKGSSERIQFPPEIKEIIDGIDLGLVKHPDEDEGEEEMKFLEYTVRLIS